MRDQAQGLRDLVKGGMFEQMGLPAVFDQSLKFDKAKLWDELKAELEAEAEGDPKKKYQRLSTRFGPKAARALLDRMLQAETMAMIRGR